MYHLIEWPLMFKKHHSQYECSIKYSYDLHFNKRFVILRVQVNVQFSEQVVQPAPYQH